jgi:starch synthase
LDVLFLSSEVAPFAKTGGLGDVAAALPRALHRSGHDVRVFMPLYSRVALDRAVFRRVESLRTLKVVVGGHAYDVAIYAAPLPGTTMDVFFVHCPPLFARHAIYSHDADEHLRFQVFCCAALECAQRMRFAPDVVHCNDWQTALVPLLLKTRFAWDQAIFGRARTVLTIHNLNYQGVFPASAAPQTGVPGESQHLFHQDQLREGRLNFLLHGILYADAITTVSPTYAAEIRTPEYGAGLEWALRGRGNAVVGILNGVDYGVWNPSTDRAIPHRYSAADLAGKARCKQALLDKAHLPSVPGVPLFGVVSRLAGQKGFALFPAVLPALLQRERFALIVTGTGERHFERHFRQLAQQFPNQVRFVNAFDDELAHQIEAAADFFLMPSRYEPCGLNQMYSLRYGAVPIVRKTGGLADTVELWNPRTGRGTGIVFDTFDPAGLRWAVQSALAVYRDRRAYERLQQNGMAQDFSWEHQVLEYEALYARLGRSG